jgi:hypothetical protein
VWARDAAFSYLDVGSTAGGVDLESHPLVQIGPPPSFDS